MSFERAAPWLQAALERDARPLWTLDDVRREVVRGASTLWCGDRSAMVVEALGPYSTGEKILSVWLAGGDLGELMSVRERAEDMAREHGCTQVHIDGRPGWARLYRDFGYEMLAVTIRKML